MKKHIKDFIPNIIKRNTVILMIRIMFVCHGNICRSPMAEYIFKYLAEKRNMRDRFSVSSSATSTEEIRNGIGNSVYPPAKKELLKHGISCDGKRAVQLKKADYDKYDLFIGMDGNNIHNMMKIFGSDPDGKIHKLLEYAKDSGDVADPWYSGRFDTAYNDILRGCAALLNSLL